MIQAAQLLTGDARRDRLIPYIVDAAQRVFGADLTLDIARALVGILWKESNGRTNQYLGDTTAPGGPSIGPMQIYRASLIDLVNRGHVAHPGFDLADRNVYATYASNEPLTIYWAVAEFRDKFAAARGDLADAIRRYNGSGPHAELYRSRVLGWLASVSWPTVGEAAGGAVLFLLAGLGIGWWWTRR